MVREMVLLVSNNISNTFFSGLKLSTLPPQVEIDTREVCELAISMTRRLSM